MDFSVKLQKLRKDRNLSQENLAEIIGVSRQAVSKWESGQTYPDIDNLVSISTYFGATVDELVKENVAVGQESTADHRAEKIVYVNTGHHYEYKSKRTLWGIPLVHVNLGRGLLVAKGILAIGNVSVGDITNGTVCIDHVKNLGSISSAQIRSMLVQEYPSLWKPVVTFISGFFKR